VFLTDDNRIALLDLGMVSHINETFQEKLLQLLLAISEGRGDEAAEIAIRMGEPKPNFDKADYKHRVASLIARQADHDSGAHRRRPRGAGNDPNLGGLLFAWRLSLR